MKGINLVVDSLDYIQKARVAAQVRQSHLAKKERTDTLTNLVLDKLAEVEEWLNDLLEGEVKKNPAHSWFSKIKGIGPVNIGKVIGHIDIEKAVHVSNLWRYAGFGVNSDGKAERITKGEKLHYNKTLKSMCWRLAKSLIRAKGAYYDFYKNQKMTLTKRLENQGIKIIESNKLPLEKGKRVEKDGYYGLGHVDMQAMRKMIKLFLQHLWIVWREAEGLPTNKPYAHEKMGHQGYIDPSEMIEPKS